MGCLRMATESFANLELRHIYSAQVIGVNSRLEIEAMQPGSPKKGQPVESLADIEKWNASLKDENKKNELLYCIHYTNWASKWNEWVTADRLTALGEKIQATNKKGNPIQKPVGKLKNTAIKAEAKENKDLVKSGTEAATETEGNSMTASQKVTGGVRKSAASISPDITSIQDQARPGIAKNRTVLQMVDSVVKPVVNHSRLKAVKRKPVECYSPSEVINPMDKPAKVSKQFLQKQNFLEVRSYDKSEFRVKKTHLFASIYILRNLSKCISSRLEELFQETGLVENEDQEILFREKRKFMRYLAENKEKYFPTSAYYPSNRRDKSGSFDKA